MKIKPIASNMTELRVNENIILFSYETPVAAWTAKRGYVKTNKYWSNTTSRHINKWLDGSDVMEVEQSEIEGMVA